MRPAASTPKAVLRHELRPIHRRYAAVSLAFAARLGGSRSPCAANLCRGSSLLAALRGDRHPLSIRPFYPRSFRLSMSEFPLFPRLRIARTRSNGCRGGAPLSSAPRGGQADPARDLRGVVPLVPRDGRDQYSDRRVIDRDHEQFVPVRVDNDTRPDVNARYNMGGWPTTAFLRPTARRSPARPTCRATEMRRALDEIAGFYADQPRRDRRSERSNCATASAARAAPHETGPHALR